MRQLNGNILLLKGAVCMKGPKKKWITKRYPILATILITLWIWYGSYHLGLNIGEFFANIKN
jgi:hypothetical protein